MSDSESALVAASQRGDRLAFEELVRRTARLLFARAYLETGDNHRAEDLVQETLLTAWRSIRQVTDASGFRPWLMSILHTATIDAQRRESRKKRGEPTTADRGRRRTCGWPIRSPPRTSRPSARRSASARSPCSAACRASTGRS